MRLAIRADNRVVPRKPPANTTRTTAPTCHHADRTSAPRPAGGPPRPRSGDDQGQRRNGHKDRCSHHAQTERRHPTVLSPARLAAVSFLARYSGATHALYRTQLAPRFVWCGANGLDPLIGIHRAHVELYIRELRDAGLMDSSVNTMMHAVRGYFRFAHPAASERTSSAACFLACSLMT